MIIKKADNLYRSIGGRANTSGVERVNRDGKMEVLQMGEAEVTPKERMNWNAKAKLDPRGRLPEEIYKVESDDGGNPMAVDDKVRTRIPRKHQYSTEARLSDQRGESPTFHKSTATSAQAHGVTEGMVADNTFVDPAKKEKGDINKRKKEKMAKGSSDYKLADAFRKVSDTLSTKDFVDSKTVAAISRSSNISVEDVLLLEKVAQSNKELAGKYRGIKGRCQRCQVSKEVPGTKETPEGLVKISLPEDDDDVSLTAEEVGLLE